MISIEIEAIHSQLTDFSDDSKVWIYYSTESFAQFSADIQSQIDEYTRSWKSHGHPVVAKGFTLYNQVIILIADIVKSEVSGCSTDGSIHFIQTLGTTYQLDFFNRNLVYYITNDNIQTCELNQIHLLDKKTIVFEPFYKNLGEWRMRPFEVLDMSKYKRLL